MDHYIRLFIDSNFLVLKSTINNRISLVRLLLYFARCNLENIEFARYIIKILEEKKGQDILLLDVAGSVTYTDFIIICTGSSNRMLNALSDAILDKNILKNNPKGRINGNPDSGWIVIDYGNLVVHLFDEYYRQYYQITDLWKNCKVLLRLQ